MNLKSADAPRLNQISWNMKQSPKSITTYWNKYYSEHLYTRILYIEGHFGKELASEIGHNIHHASSLGLL